MQLNERVKNYSRAQSNISVGLLTVQSYFLFRVTFFRFYQVVSLVKLALYCLLLVYRTHFVPRCVLLQCWLDWRILDVLMLNLVQIKLLRAKHRTRSSNTRPSDEDLSWDLVVLHCENTDQSSCTAKTSFAVYSDCACAWLCEVLLTSFNKTVDDVLGRHRTVDKNQVLMLNPFVCESSAVVFGIVEPHNFGDF